MLWLSKAYVQECTCPLGVFERYPANHYRLKLAGSDPDYGFNHLYCVLARTQVGFPPYDPDTAAVRRLIPVRANVDWSRSHQDVC